MKAPAAGMPCHPVRAWRPRLAYWGHFHSTPLVCGAAFQHATGVLRFAQSHPLAPLTFHQHADFEPHAKFMASMGQENEGW